MSEVCLGSPLCTVLVLPEHFYLDLMTFNAVPYSDPLQKFFAATLAATLRSVLDMYLLVQRLQTSATLAMHHHPHRPCLPIAHAPLFRRGTCLAVSSEDALVWIEADVAAETFGRSGETPGVYRHRRLRGFGPRSRPVELLGLGVQALCS